MSLKLYEENDCTALGEKIREHNGEPSTVKYKHKNFPTAISKLTKITPNLELCATRLITTDGTTELQGKLKGTDTRSESSEISWNGNYVNSPIKFYKEGETTPLDTVKTGNTLCRTGWATLPTTITTDTTFQAKYEGISEKYTSTNSNNLEVIIDDTVLKGMYRKDNITSPNVTYDPSTDTLTIIQYGYGSTTPYTCYDITDCSKTLEITYTYNSSQDENTYGIWQGLDWNTCVMVRRDTTTYGNNTVILIRGYGVVDILHTFSEHKHGSHDVKIQLTGDKGKIWFDNTYIDEFTHSINGKIKNQLHCSHNYPLSISNLQFNWI